MSRLTVFNNPTFGQLRTFLVDDDPWFVAKDVCSVLGYTNVSKAISMWTWETNSITKRY